MELNSVVRGPSIDSDVLSEPHHIFGAAMVLSFGNGQFAARGGGVSAEIVGAQRAIENFAKQGKDFAF